MEVIAFMLALFSLGVASHAEKKIAELKDQLEKLQARVDDQQ
ncbi:MAG: hypothetical protein ACE361_03850 [Aureliella sp.]